MTITRPTKHTPTTAEQRKILFETWQKTGNIKQACFKAKVSRATFYYWKTRFIKEGYQGLHTAKSRAPKNPHRTSLQVVEQVLALKHQHPSWGKLRIATALRQQQPPINISANTVRRILIDAGLWHSLS